MPGPYYLLSGDGDPSSMDVVPLDSLLLQNIEGDTPVGPYQVTVNDVYGLCPDAQRDTDDEDHPTPITDQRVAAWIAAVSASAQGKVGDLSTLTQPRAGLAAGMLRTAVMNGAASYLEAARYASDAGVNDGGGYSAVLWARYEQALADAAKTIADWVTDAAVDPGPIGPEGPCGTGWGSFPPPRIPDWPVRW